MGEMRQAGVQLMGMLDGIRVLELASFITGPYAGMLLGDAGAEVIKVEQPGQGDPFRSWGEDLWSPQFCAYNRNKKSITLDLRVTAAQEVFCRLAESADVVVENYRPGVAERLGVDYARLQAINPRLIYCSITAFGSHGPYRERPGYDTVAQGTSGMLSLFLNDADIALRGPAISDSVTGLTAVYGILTALVHRERTGRGALVDTSLLQASLAFLSEPFGHYFGSGEVPGPFTRAATAQAYVFRCADDRRLAVHISSPEKFWEALVRCVERADLLEDPRFADRSSRLANYDQLQAALAPVFAEKPRSTWLARLDEFDVPCTPIYALDEVLDDPQVQHLNMVLTMQHERNGRVRAIANPVRYDDCGQTAATPPPVLGEHTESVIRSLGFSAADYETLVNSKAI